MSEDSRTEVLTIDGMSCQHCVSSVREALDALDGVTVNAVEIGRAETTVSAATAHSTLVQAIEDAGFDVVGSETADA